MQWIHLLLYILFIIINLFIVDKALQVQLLNIYTAINILFSIAESYKYGELYVLRVTSTESYGLHVTCTELHVLRVMSYTCNMY